MGQGNVLIPPHLRVLHVSQDSLFIKDTLYNNLTYGNAKDDHEASPQRVMEICKKLQIPDWIIEFLDEKQEKKYKEICEWGEVLSLTQRTLLNFARALVSNPEI